MLTYKAIGAFSPFIIYGFSDKIKMPRLPSNASQSSMEQIIVEKSDIEIDFHPQNKVGKHLMETGLQELMAMYKPPAIYHCEEKGGVFNFQEGQKRKVLFIVPGVTGCSEEPYIKEVCGVALQNGYNPVVLNHTATKDDDLELRVLDMSDSKIMRESIERIHNKYGQDVEIYGVGFSLGANHLLRYLGDHHHDHGMKAAISVSNPFDVLATTIRMRFKFFGIYDRAIRDMLALGFTQGKFKLDRERFDHLWLTKAKGYKSIYEFDNHVRAKILGYNSIHGLYREVSCDRFLNNINIPFLVLHSRDDPICPMESVPYSDLMNNPNCVIVSTKIGGHCDFFTKIPGKPFKYQRAFSLMIK
ncbi:embryogenesis-associated protein emb8-like [Stylonychia lemnae]|uniref:Embryogenesis-associated protein emb8-like n=1 Tax=Stylonychia lemnae TaxID=5949 RepID=A0A078AS06_STYLE|nr:embryogenesis-associated protein emb8-like [Stylonychia lemnae]|eukprot:CDW85265.1 embryogenesis-associated protein emb8-like [Stylonychia lemnae]